MAMTRRDFLWASAMGAVVVSVGGCASHTPRAAIERRDLFPQGVASGDPQADKVILWTRRPPTADSLSQHLSVEIAADAAFKQLIATGVATLSADTDWTCRFLATGLQANRFYWYRFVDEHGYASRVGRTRTAPQENSDVPVSFTFASCQSPNESALNAYRRMIYEDEQKPLDEQLHFVLHLGDFIYEVTWYAADNKQGLNRGRRIRDLYKFPQGEKAGNFHLPVSLEDYRTLYRAYLQDPDLQDARARWPFICVWDNHEFAWQGYQSQYVAPGVDRPSQSKKVIANQAWWEFIPAWVQKPGDPAIDKFVAPTVVDTPIAQFDEDGLGTEPNNLLAVNSLKIERVLRFGKNVDLFLTDNWSFRSPPADGGAFTVPGLRWVYPEHASEILEYGRHYNNGHAPEQIRFNGKDYPNPAKDMFAQTYLGRRQKAWLLQELAQSKARWKIWGHSFGTLDLRSDYHNLPATLGVQWPADAGYALINSQYLKDRDDIFDFVATENITGMAIVAGDRHAFYAGLASKTLPPKPFQPVAVEFITGSISQQTLQEVAEQVIAKDAPLRFLHLQDHAGEQNIPAMNVTALHGVLAALTLNETGDINKARAVRNPDVAPHLSFLDQGGNGYALVRVNSEHIETEFICIERPLERSDRADGGALNYRVTHQARLWAANEAPKLTQQIVEGNPIYCI